MARRHNASAACVGLWRLDNGTDLVNTVNLGPTDELGVSDFESFATRRGATYIEHPMELVAVTHDLDRELVLKLMRVW